MLCRESAVSGKPPGVAGEGQQREDGRGPQRFSITDEARFEIGLAKGIVMFIRRKGVVINYNM